MSPSAEEWIEVRVAATQNRQAVMEALFAEGSLGIQERDNELVTYFLSGTDVVRLRQLIGAVDPVAEVAIHPATLARNHDWHGTVTRQQVGALTITPPWLAESLDSDATIIIEPAMAFGTGEHGTTRGVLRLIQTIPLGGKTVADLGAGSAVLAIAAAKLGATKVIAVELDPDATENANENIARNSVAERVHFIEGDAFAILPLLAPVDIVFANILSSVLIELLPTIHDSLVADGKAILSGILIDERPAIVTALKGQWRIDDEDVEGEWWSVLISRV